MHGAGQFLSVVDPAAQHNLPAQADAGIGKAAEIGKHLPCALVFHHGAAQFRVGGVHRHVDRGNVHFDDAVNVAVMQVGQRDIVAVQKGKAAVIVFEIKGGTEPFGQLVDKAENALVGTGVLFVHQGRFKVQPDVVIRAFVNGNGVRRAVPCEFYGHALIGKIKAIVQHVGDFIAVHPQQFIPRSDPGECRATVFFHPANANHMLPPFAVADFFIIV